MFRNVFLLIAILVAVEIRDSCAYTWVKSAGVIPENAIKKDWERYQTRGGFVGRARHFNSLLPADVHNASYAVVRSCGKEWKKTEFEILVANESCHWQVFQTFPDLPTNIVLVGRLNDNGTIYVALETQSRDMYMGTTDGKLIRLVPSMQLVYDSVRKYNLHEVKILVCEDLHTWIDTSASEVPKNAIVAKTSEEGHNLYVGRILNECDMIPALVDPQVGLAIGEADDDVTVKSPFCQVLVGPAENYQWIEASGGEIPDGAVHTGTHLPNGTPRYVALLDGTLSSIDYATAVPEDSYKVLARKDGDEKVRPRQFFQERR